jgi:hypothetical protein
MAQFKKTSPRMDSIRTVATIASKGFNVMVISEAIGKQGSFPPV